MDRNYNRPMKNLPNWTWKYRDVISRISVTFACVLIITLFSKCAADDATGASATTSTCLINITPATAGAQIALQASPVPTADATVVPPLVNDGDELAQSITPTESFQDVKSATLTLQSADVTEALLVLTIQGDVAGAPDGTALATSTVQSLQVSTSSEQKYVFYFDRKMNFLKDMTYWFVLKGTYTKSGTAYIKWSSNTAEVYTRGKAIYETSVAGIFAETAYLDTDGTNKRDFIMGLGCN